MTHRSDLLRTRFTAFGTAAARYCSKLPRDHAAVTISRQLARAALAPGALYSEARDAESPPDYVHKLKVCLKELRESAHWLDCASELYSQNHAADALKRECSELTAICVACIKKARGRPRDDGAAGTA